MFKRKSNLPPRPKLPTVDQIIEDLSAIQHEDPLFLAARNINYKGLRAEDAQEQDESYQNIKKFLELNQLLQDALKEVNAIDEDLTDAEKHIRNSFDGLKEKISKVTP